MDANPVRGVRSIAFGRDRDGTQYLLASSEQHLALMRIPAGWSGEPLESRLIPSTSRMAVRKMLLTDLDQDGWIDAVVGLSGESASGLVLWGPLSETFDAYAAAAKTID